MSADKSWSSMSDDERFSRIQENRANRMKQIDDLSPELRSLVHSYGWPIVKSLLDHGVSRPRAIRHIVETILDEFSPTRGSFAKQGVRVNVEVVKQQ